jgi:glycosyltransferase involved in cell wall biosynthesis
MKFVPEISVVITCFNYGHYLEGCLNSVFNQTYQDFEIVVVDDGSTDSTREVAEAFMGRPNFRYINQENSGQARAKNRGIEMARGRYLAFLDADDLWEEEKLAKQIRLFERPSVGVVYSRAHLIDEAGAPRSLNFSGKYLQPRSGMVSRWLIFDNFVWFSSAIVRKECLERFGGFDETFRMGIDWDLWLRISTRYEFDFVDEPLLLYRVGHSGQMSENVEVRLKCSDCIMEKFITKHPGAVDEGTIKEAYFHSFCNRGNHYRRIDKKKSYSFFFKAIRVMPFRKEAYKGLSKSLINHGIAAIGKFSSIGYLQ